MAGYFEAVKVRIALSLLQQLDLTEDERAATSGDAEAVKGLLARLADQPTLEGSGAPHGTPRAAGLGSQPTA